MNPRQDKTNSERSPENSVNCRSGVSGQHQNEEELNGKRREVSTERSQKQNFSQLGRSPGDFVKEPSPNLFGTGTGFSRHGGEEWWGGDRRWSWGWVGQKAELRGASLSGLGPNRPRPGTSPQPRFGFGDPCYKGCLFFN